MAKEKKEPKKIGAGLVFSWIFSLIFLLLGLGMLIQVKIVSGIFFILAGLIIDPAFKKFIKKKFNLEFSKGLIVLIAIVCLIVAFSTMGGTTSTNNSSSKTNEIHTYQVGEPITLNSFKYTINSVEQKTNIIGAMGYLTKEGNFLIVDLTLENVGNEAEYINDELYIVDSQNREFESDYEYSMYVDNYLSSINKINPGLSETGQLVFDIPENLEGKLCIKKNMWATECSAYIQL